MTLIDALHCKNTDRPPIWLMRQAGRYMPEYQEIRKGRALLDMFHDEELIVEITRQPVDILGVDGAILFSDILTVLDGLGIRYHFEEGIGPVILDDYQKMAPLDPAKAYGHIERSIKALKKELSVPLLGFAGAPFTILSYLVEKRSSKDFKNVKKLLYQNESAFKALIEELTDATIDYLLLQVEAGVDGVQLFDSWASTLDIESYKHFCFPSLKRIVEAIQAKGCPIILFKRGDIRSYIELEPSAIAFDWTNDIKEILSLAPKTLALQGNLDPMLLYGSMDTIKERVDRLLDATQEHPGYIFNLGHGMLPDLSSEKTKHLVDYVKDRSQKVC